jgi:hypothetical protein
MDTLLILCEIPIESDSRGVEGLASELCQTELRTTNHYGYPRNESTYRSASSISPQQQLGKVNEPEYFHISIDLS